MWTPVETIQLVFRPSLVGQDVVHPLGASQVTFDEDIPRQRALTAFLHEPIHDLHQLRAVFAHRPGDGTAGVDRQVFVDLDLFEDLRPKLGLVAVHDDGGNHAHIHHVQEIVVLQALLGERRASYSEFLLATVLAQADLEVGGCTRAPLICCFIGIFRCL